jgi:hypothetical protein
MMMEIKKIINYIIQFILNIKIKIFENEKGFKENDSILDSRWKVDKNGKFLFKYKYDENEDLEKSKHSSNIKLIDMISILNKFNEEINFETTFMINSVNILPNYNKNLSKMGYNKKPHLIENFEEIKKHYQEILLDSINVEEEEKNIMMKSDEILIEENNFLNQIIKNYIFSPYNIDEYYRDINNKLYFDFDNDPMNLFENENNKNELKEFKEKFIINQKYPKFRILSMNSIKERENRREILLSKYFIDRIISIFNNLEIIKN